ncbi:MAG: M50 family metallopeptidase [Lentimicrobium sp.]|nr:M50 family metallopeptidase [Lentimicrobium sp.]
MDVFSRNPHLVFYAILASAMLILRIPLIGRYFRTVNTLLHESGHAIAAILTSGEVINVELSSDTSGSAFTKSGSKIKALLVSFSGYPIAAFISGLLIALTVNGQHKIAFFILISIALINLAFFVRNAYGVVWLITFSGLIIFTFWLDNKEVSFISALSVSLISLSESVFSTLTILFLGFHQPRKAGDATNLAKITKVPAAIWSILITMLVGIIVYYTVSFYFPNPFQPIT